MRAPAELGPEARQEVVHVSRDNASQPDHDKVPASREQKLHQQQAVWHQLSWNSDDVKGCILASSILCCGVTHGYQDSLHIRPSTSEALIENL